MQLYRTVAAEGVAFPPLKTVIDGWGHSPTARKPVHSESQCSLPLCIVISVYCIEYTSVTDFVFYMESNNLSYSYSKSHAVVISIANMVYSHTKYVCSNAV